MSLPEWDGREQRWRWIDHVVPLSQCRALEKHMRFVAAMGAISPALLDPLPEFAPRRTIVGRVVRCVPNGKRLWFTHHIAQYRAWQAERAALGAA